MQVDIIQMVFSLAVLVFSVVAHEVSHGYMAQYLGDPTARLAGRLTANPIKHLDPFGSFLVPISLFFLTAGGFVIGWAKPVPYNPYNLRDQKWGDAKVALAGPLTNIGIAVIFAMILRASGDFLTGDMLWLMYTIVHINVGLAVFNLVPIPPLDGSKVLFNALPLRLRYVADYLERYSMVLFLFFVFFLWQLIVPLVSFIELFLVG